jgi:hypothetical protein
MIMLKSPNLLIDALYNVHTASGASDDYARGLVVGVVSTLMAVTGDSFEEVLPVVVKHIPLSFDPDRLPPAFRTDCEDERERQCAELRAQSAKCADCDGCDGDPPIVE